MVWAVVGDAGDFVEGFLWAVVWVLVGYLEGLFWCEVWEPLGFWCLEEFFGVVCGGVAVDVLAEVCVGFVEVLDEVVDVCVDVVEGGFVGVVVLLG